MRKTIETIILSVLITLPIIAMLHTIYTLHHDVNSASEINIERLKLIKENDPRYKKELTDAIEDGRLTNGEAYRLIRIHDEIQERNKLKEILRNKP